MNKRILFVDDEPNLLQGLSRMLRSMRHEWDMDFAEGGPEALKLMSQKPYDVVVSDMRMPIMDGNVLLTQVKERYPHVVRMILSGHADRKMILQSVKVAHQYLSKPCDSEKLKAVINNSLALRGLLSSEELKRLVSQIEKLPSLPTLYVEIMAELESPDSSMKKVGKIISEDISMTAKMLQLVNSAFFGNFQNITSAEEASIVLGMDTVKALVLSLEVFSMSEMTKISEKFYNNLWNHSKAVGSLARMIAKDENCEQNVIDNALMAGMLHDMGRLILAANLPDQYVETFALSRNKDVALSEAEREVFGASHAEVGAYLLSLWGFPDPILEALAFHHSPEENKLKEFTPLAAVHVANALVHETQQDCRAKDMLKINDNYLSELGLLERLPRWRELCNELDEEENQK